MPKLKLLFFLALIIGVFYCAYQTHLLNALAQTSMVQDIQSKIAETKIYNQTIRRQSKDNIEFMSFLSKINTDEFNEISKTYTDLNSRTSDTLTDLSENEALKSIAITYARYEKLNSYIYRLVGKMQSASQTINDSGFDTSNVDREIETLTFSLSSIEANNAGIKFIMDKLQNHEISTQSAVQQVLRIGDESKIEYTKVFSELTSLLQK